MEVKKLILHSDHTVENIQLEEAFTKICGDLNNFRMGYIPSQSDTPEKKWFNDKREWYGQFGISDFLYFDVDQDYTPELQEELFNCNAIYLSGGCTYYFLKNLKKRNMLKPLRDYVHTGGILIGLSAGSILMTNDISISGFHDHNQIGLEDFSALNLVDFEFYPHFEPDNQDDTDALIKYSMQNNTTVYACKDGDGLFINNDSIDFYGDAYCFKKGTIQIISNLRNQRLSR